MKQFSLPSLRDTTQAFCSYVLGKKTYRFVFTWCEEFVIVDMYFIGNGDNNYILRGYPLVPDCDLIRRIKDDEIISGTLFVKNKYNKDCDITQSNFDSDFELVYYDKDEIEILGG